VIEVVKLLGQDPLLVHLEGRHRGKLAFPYSHGVVLSNITRRQFKSQEGFNAVFQSNLIICKDEFYESVDPLALQERLWNLSPYSYGESLTSTQIDRIRWHIFPEVRINAKPLSLALAEPTVEVSTVLPEVLQVMDLEQEQLARSLGEGHGVAGSGKTLILVYRCLHLAQQQELPILVLCFNVALASKLRHLLHEKAAWAGFAAITVPQPASSRVIPPRTERKFNTPVSDKLVLGISDSESLHSTQQFFGRRNYLG
jgi:hypothetical protein